MRSEILIFMLFTLCEASVWLDRCQSELPSDPSSGCCGIDVTTSNRIIGGSKTSLRQYPWLGLMQYSEKTTGRPAIGGCGAFLISSRYVVTAAHCVDGKGNFQPIGVRLGEYDKSHKGKDCVKERLHGRPDCISSITVPIGNITIHEDYVVKKTKNQIKTRNDIALIKLKKVVSFSDHIRPICLPTSDITVEGTHNLRFDVAGWGITSQTKLSKRRYRNIGSNIKQHISLPFWPNKKCHKVRTISDTQICAGGENHRDTCLGDSGGPLMYNRDGVYEAVGVLSYGTGAPCGKHGYPSVSTKVYAYLGWIKKHMH